MEPHGSPQDESIPGTGTVQVERGNHEALLNAGQSYSSMWKRQAAGIMEDPDSPREEDRCQKMSKGWGVDRFFMIFHWNGGSMVNTMHHNAINKPPVFLI